MVNHQQFPGQNPELSLYGMAFPLKSHCCVSTLAEFHRFIVGEGVVEMLSSELWSRDV